MSRISSSEKERDETSSTRTSSQMQGVVVHVPVPSNHETVEIAGGESSDGEGDVEIENYEAGGGTLVGTDAEGSPQRISSASYTIDYGSGPAGVNAALTPAVIRHISKRTIISRQQKMVLEEFYRCGMNSASLQVHHLHVAASEKTGLDINVVKKGGHALMYDGYVYYKIRDGGNGRIFWRCTHHSRGCEARLTTISNKRVESHRNEHDHFPEIAEVAENWVRNRKRPRMTEKLGEKSVHLEPERSVGGFSIPLSLTQAPGIPSLISTTAIPIRSSLSNEGAPDPKRVCVDHMAAVRHQPNLPVHHTAAAVSLLPPSSSSPSLPLVVRVRVSESGEEDFVEAEVSSPTYHALLSACCQELEVATSDIVRIRKLPNIWVRKDRDVQRMREGQELEVVLKSDVTGVYPSCSTTSVPLTSVLTVNPFSSSNTIPIFSLQPSAGIRSVDVDHGNLIAALTSDGQASLQDLAPSSHVNGLQ